MSMKDRRNGFGWLQPNLQGYSAGSTLGAQFFFSFSFLLFTPLLTADERENLYRSIQGNAGSKDGEWLLMT